MKLERQFSGSHRGQMGRELPPSNAAESWAPQNGSHTSPPIREVDQDLLKLQELCHYVIWRLDDENGCHAAKLFQILWCSEIHSFLQSNKFISGVKYVRSRHGLRPKSWDLVCDALVSNGSIRHWVEQHGLERSVKYSALQPPFPICLEKDELASVNYWIDNFEKYLGSRNSVIFCEAQR